MHQPITSSAEAAPASTAAIFASGPAGPEPRGWGKGRGKGERVLGPRRPLTLKVKRTKWVEQVVAKETQPTSVPWRWAGRGVGRPGTRRAGARRERRDVTPLTATEMMLWSK